MSAHAEWMALVELSGLVVSEPVLDERFPTGPPTVPRGLHAWFRSRAEHLAVALSRHDAPGVRRWVDFLLETVLELPPDRWLKGPRVPATCRVFLDEYQQELVPDRVLSGADGKAALLVSIVPPDQELDRRDQQPGRWRASPGAKLERLLRDTGHELGLVTNGTAFRLLYAPAGMTAGAITWTTPGMVQEKSTLDAFAGLLGRVTLVPTTGAGLHDLCRSSRERQGEVADQLGAQVRDGMERLLLAWDEADRATSGALFAAMPDARLYEMGLGVMMRLVFLLYAEERALLPHGEVLYDQAYGVTFLWHRLQEQARDREGTLDTTFDAWHRLLATARLLHAGSRHPDLSLRAYGGSLFDPTRWPVLEDPRCRVSNRTVYEVLRRLLFAKGRGTEFQRVGYWALDVEQVGYLYEGLLDHTCSRAGAEVLVKLRGAGEATTPLAQLEARHGDALASWVVERSGWKAERVTAALAAGDPSAEAVLRALPPDVAIRVRPFAGVVQCDEVVPPGWRYLTLGTSRRDTGTQYTPQSLTAPVVQTALEPLVYRCEEGKPGKLVEPREVRRPRELLALRVCDPAMGSGAFLVQVVRYLADRLVEAWDREVARHPEGTVLGLPFAEPAADAEGQAVLRPEDRAGMVLAARRLVVERSVYGVDVNPLAVEMGKLSLWLATLSRDRPFTFLDHALKCGDSLLGADLDQLRTWSWDRTGSGAAFLERFLDQAVDDALAPRRELEELGEGEGGATKARLLAKAEAAVVRARVAADLLMGAWIGGATPKEREGLRERLGVLVSAAATSEDWEVLRRRSGELLGGRRPLHWPLEYPEILVDRGGFDALVGNPPFVGGKKITGNLGVPYREWLVEVLANGCRGHADLVAYFFLRGLRLVREGGGYAFVAVDTLAQGDTREVGLDQVVAAGATIRNANTARDWPGRAGIRIVTVCTWRGLYRGPHLLDGERVSTITTILDASEVVGMPFRLKANEPYNYQGSVVLGMGFVLAQEAAERLLAAHPRNAEVIQPYVNGEDVNTHPGQSSTRWVINFRDWTEEKARSWPDVFAVIEADVKPERTRRKPDGSFKLREPLPTRWWHYADKRPALYRALAPLRRALVMSRVSKYFVPAWSPTGRVFSERLVVFPFADDWAFSVLQSTFHDAWATRYMSTFESRPMYAPEDCFETFPLPLDTSPLDAIGERYHEHRRQLMLARQIGLTKTYNLFHGKPNEDEDIATLRALHVELDIAVRDAYGWFDLDLGLGWQKTTRAVERKDRKTGNTVTVEEVDWRYTISPAARDELLRRLLALNHQRYAEEVAAGLHDAKKGKKEAEEEAPTDGPSPPTKPKRRRPPEPAGPTLFRLPEDR